MSTCPEFIGFPKSLGFIVEVDQTINEAAADALREWAENEVTEHNLDVYLSSGQITQIQQFPDTNEGWDEAFELVEDTMTY